MDSRSKDRSLQSRRETPRKEASLFNYDILLNEKEKQ